jgi:hypothetical protein
MEGVAMQDASSPGRKSASFSATRLTASAVGRIRLVRRRVAGELAPWADARAIPSLAILAALNCVAAMLVLRRLGGGPPPHLTNTRLCIAAAAVALLGFASRWNLARLERSRPRLALRALLATFGVLPLTVLLAAVTNRHSPWAVSVVSGLAVATWTTLLTWRGRGHGGRESADAQPVRAELELLRLPAAAPAVPRVGDRNAARGSSADRTADEWIERSIDASGRVTLRGRLCVTFAAGQTHATAHVPFAPLFAELPEFSCEVIDHPSLRARPAVYRYGARLELRRADGIPEALKVSLRFQATGSGAAISRAA